MECNPGIIALSPPKNRTTKKHQNTSLSSNAVVSPALIVARYTQKDLGCMVTHGVHTYLRHMVSTPLQTLLAFKEKEEGEGNKCQKGEIGGGKERKDDKM